LVSTHVSAQAITVLSSRADTVSGGDALIAVAMPNGASVSDVKVVVGGSDVTSSFRAKGNTMIGLVSGLKPGKNEVAANVAGSTGRLTLHATVGRRSHFDPLETVAASESGPSDAPAGTLT
jgi:hypothetical protein